MVDFSGAHCNFCHSACGGKLVLGILCPKDLHGSFASFRRNASNDGFNDPRLYQGRRLLSPLGGAQHIDVLVRVEFFKLIP